MFVVLRIGGNVDVCSASPSREADGTGIVVDVGVDVVHRSSPQGLGYLADHVVRWHSRRRCDFTVSSDYRMTTHDNRRTKAGYGDDLEGEDVLDFNSGASKSGGEVPDERASDVGGQGVDYGRA